MVQRWGQAQVLRLLTLTVDQFSGDRSAGLAEDVLPSFQSKKKGDRSPEFEEQRRNCFVAVTRCEQTLTLSYAKRYFGYAKAPSQFLKEMGLLSGDYLRETE